ncbi:MAG: 50S ribosomal protein L4 [Erysipelotrichaceae bacterium]|jgi:large subunit ribosomal protein L4|nr:50S ribosomal protein L4 [Erysipelotrichaceae bacterium]
MLEKKIHLPLLNVKGEKVKDVTLKNEVFNVEMNKDAVYSDVKVYHSNLRQATAKTKTRSEVNGGGRKPFRQKGTGQARAGSSRSPIWVGGGNIFGPRGNQNFKLKQNRKVHRLALKAVLSEKVKSGLIVVDEMKLETNKTKELLAVLKALKVGKKAILVVGYEDEVANLALASRNLPLLTDVIYPEQLTTYDVLYTDSLILTSKALAALEEVLG